jgi:hypothetical protein
MTLDETIALNDRGSIAIVGALGVAGAMTQQEELVLGTFSIGKCAAIAAYRSPCPHSRTPANEDR